MTPDLSLNIGPTLPVYYPLIEVDGITYFDLGAQIKLYDSGQTMTPQDNIFYGDQTSVTPPLPLPPTSSHCQNIQNT